MEEVRRLTVATKSRCILSVEGRTCWIAGYHGVQHMPSKYLSLGTPVSRSVYRLGCCCDDNKAEWRHTAGYRYQREISVQCAQVAALPGFVLLLLFLPILRPPNFPLPKPPSLPLLFICMLICNIRKKESSAVPKPPISDLNA